MKTVLIIILIFLSSAVAINILLVSLRMSRMLASPRYKSYEETLRRSKEEEHSYGEFDSFEKEPFEVTLRDGYVVRGDVFPLDPKKVVLISHGHGDNKYTGIRFVRVFRDLGYSTVIYDLRGHGHNKPFVCTMGLNESKDLIEVLAAVRERFPDAEIGLHGLSMGCATTVMALKYKPEVRFAVADCGYGFLENICLDTIKSLRAPAWMMFFVNLACSHRYGYRPSDVKPIDSLDDNEIPVCFIHGTEDKLISYHQSEWMYARNKGSRKELHLIPESAHAKAWAHDPAAYEKIVSDFIASLD